MCDKCEDNARQARYLDECLETIIELEEKYDRLFKAHSLEMVRADVAEQQRDDLQYRLDSLMLEYCPQDMTKEQIAAWWKAQRPVEV
jgi:hypothetical protein